MILWINTHSYRTQLLITTFPQFRIRISVTAFLQVRMHRLLFPGMKALYKSELSTMADVVHTVWNCADI